MKLNRQRHWIVCAMGTGAVPTPATSEAVRKIAREDQTLVDYFGAILERRPDEIIERVFQPGK